MRILCPEHGLQDGVLISDDLAKRRKMPIQTIIYTFESRPIGVYFVSNEFAESRGIQEGTYPLLDDLLEWTLELRPICKQCLASIHNGHITADHQWVEGTE